MAERIYLSLAHMSEAALEKKYMNEAVDTNWVVPLGPNVDAFEQQLQDFFGKPVAALASGTAAVHLALIAAGVGPGDEVLTQSFTFCASAHPISYIGATPIFIDSELDTWNMDPQLLEKAILDRKQKTGRLPKAILPVYLYGMPPKMDEIMAIARKYGIAVVEDAAEGFGSRFDGCFGGTIGDYGILSFNGNKMITTSGGGAVICPTAEAKERVTWYATQAREAYPYYQHEAIGFNYRMSNICAGIGRGQMTVARDHIAHHRHVAQLYKKAFANMDGITFHDELPGMESNFWLSTVLLDESLKVKGEEKAYAQPVKGAVGGAAGVVHSGGAIHTDCEPNVNVETMRLALLAEGIESRPLWKPMHKQPVYRRTLNGTKLLTEELADGVVCQTSSSSIAYVNGISEHIFHRGLCLPSGPMVRDADVERIISTIKANTNS